MKRDLLIIMTKYTLILAPLEVFAKRTFLGQGPETAALPDPEQWKIKVRRQASSSKLVDNLKKEFDYMGFYGINIINAFIANAAQDGRQLKLDEVRRLVHKSCVARSTART